MLFRSYPVGSNPSAPLDTPERYADGRKLLEAELVKAGRDPGTIAQAYLALGRCQPTEQKASSGGRQPYTGRPADVASDIVRFGSAGVAHFFLNFPAPTVAEALDDLAWFAGEVRPLIRP